MHPIPLIHEISLCVMFYKMGVKNSQKKVEICTIFSHHASSNKNLLDAWLWQIQTTQAHAQGKYWTHFTDAWYWCTENLWDAWLAEFAHYTHTCLARRKQLVSRKKLARSCDLNTRPLLATSLILFYKTV